MAMNRRSFMRAVVTSPLVGAFAVAVGLPRKYGHLTVAMSLERGYLPAQVFLDGHEIGKDCPELDDIEGWVDVHKRNAEGHVYLNETRTEVVKERRYGQVRFVPNPNGRPGKWPSDD